MCLHSLYLKVSFAGYKIIIIFSLSILNILHHFVFWYKWFLLKNLMRFYCPPAYLFFFFNFTILLWFCHISTWIHHGYTRVPHPEPSSLLPPHTIPLGRPSAPAPSIQYCASNLDWQLVSYMIFYMFQCHSPISSHPLPLWISSNEVDETEAYYTEWSKPERKTPIQYTNTYIWNLERW